MSKLLNPRDLAPYLKMKREVAGLTQAQVSKRLGYSTTQFVSNWERGIGKPPYKALAKLIRLYGLDAQELVELCLKSMEKELRRELSFKVESRRRRLPAAA